MVIRPITTLSLRMLIPWCVMGLCVWTPLGQAQPRLLADAEMDQICAKGLPDYSVSSVAFDQMFFNFSRATSLGQVSGSGLLNLSLVPSVSGKTQISFGSPSAAGTTPVTIPATDIQVVNGTVQVTGDLTINMPTLPSVMRALQQTRVVLPPGFNPLAGTLPRIQTLR